MKKLCIFDLDGTLVNTLFSIASFANEALLACGYRGFPKNSIGIWWEMEPMFLCGECSAR